MVCISMRGSTAVFTLMYFLAPVQSLDDVVQSLSGFFIGARGLGLPAYTERITVNDVTLFYHDSRMNSIAQCPKWLNTTACQQHWEDIRDISHHNRQTMSTALLSAMQQFNLTGSAADVNIYQGYSRCDLYANGTIKAMLSHAFNGKDFLSLDIDSKTYIASVPQALKYKRQRERNPVLISITASFYQRTCFDRLRVFLDHAPGVKMKKAPEVRLFERRRVGTTLLTCHVTGFYPRAVQVEWMGPGLQVVDDEMNEVLPNGDGTYQTRRSVIRPEEKTGDQRYGCVVHHSSLQGNITLTWDKAEGGVSAAVWITLACVIATVLLGLVIRFIIRRRDAGI